MRRGPRTCEPGQGSPRSKPTPFPTEIRARPYERRACQLAGFQTEKVGRNYGPDPRFKETIGARVERDPKSRKELLREAIEYMFVEGGESAKNRDLRLNACEVL